MKFNKSMVYTLLLVFSLLGACGGKDEPEVSPKKEEIPDTSEIYSVKVNPGNKRIKLSWLLKTDPKVTKVKLYWNNKTDSVEVAVKKKTGIDTMQVMLTNLKEGSHTFRIFTSDGVNAPTYKVNVSGTVYGDTYASGLQPRGIKSTTISKGTNLIDWSSATVQAIAVELKYTDNTGATKEVIVPANATTTLLEKYTPGHFFEYRTLFLPDPAALDTFYTGYTSSRNAIRYRSIITKQIADKSNLIKTVLADTLIELHPGVEQTNLHYEGKDGRLITLYVLAADLTNNNIAVRAATPNNSPDFTRQVVSEIARHVDASGNRVLAAVNADYFVNNVPQGVVVKQGTAIKPESRADAGYFGILKDGMPVIGTYGHFQNNSGNMQEALGAFHRLINNGAKVTQGDLSVEPRTIVGYTSSKTVYFIVIDGRQTGYSLGMSFAQASDVLAALGVREGINMDGGGSSTLVVKENATNTWKVGNKPSDGSQRAVANAWTIVSTE